MFNLPETSTGEETDRIAFAMLTGGNFEIFAANGDGTTPVNLTQSPAADYEPSWSPDGTHITFTRLEDPQRDYRGQIYVMASDGSDQRNISNNTCGDWQPAWSPDGTTIALYRISKPGCNGQGIFLMDPDGSNVRQPPGLDDNALSQPRWSPDGTQLLFMNLFGPEGTQLEAMDIDGANRHTFPKPTMEDTGHKRQDGDGAWSPDGSRIVFSGDYDLYTMSTDGSSQKRLTTSRAITERDPTWSGDSSTILITLYHNIYAMDADGTNLRPLLAGLDVVY